MWNWVGAIRIRPQPAQLRPDRLVLLQPLGQDVVLLHELGDLRLRPAERVIFDLNRLALPRQLVEEAAVLGILDDRLNHVAERTDPRDAWGR